MLRAWGWGLLGGVIFALVCATTDRLFYGEFRPDYFDVMVAFAAGYTCNRS